MRFAHLPRRGASVAEKIEAVSIDIFHGELVQTPALLLERFNDSRAPRAQFLVSRINVRCKYPVNSRFKRAASSAKENHGVVARDGADIASRILPTNLEAECVAVMLLSSLHVLNREFRRGLPERRSHLRLVHDTLLFRCGSAAGYEAGLRPAVKVHRVFGYALGSACGP